MRKESEDQSGLWYRVSREERKRLVAIGGLFYKQKELATLLETTPGRLARFRRDNDIYMPFEKLNQSDRRFTSFTKLRERLLNPETKPTVTEEKTEESPRPFVEDPSSKDLEAGYFLSNLIIKKMEEERTIPRWGKCWWPTLPKRRGEPVRYTCEDSGSPLCEHHQRELGNKPLILHLASPYPPRRGRMSD